MSIPPAPDGTHAPYDSPGYRSTALRHPSKPLQLLPQRLTEVTGRAGWPPVTNLLTQWASPWLVETVAAFSVMTHFDSIQKGVIDSRDVIFFLSMIVFCLFTTSVIIRAHRAG